MVTTELVSGLRANVKRLLGHLSRGRPILVAYDCDSNHAPVMRGGTRAHWAVILGFVHVSLDPMAGRRQQELLRRRQSLADADCDFIASCAAPAQQQQQQQSQLLLLARQGKSRHMGMWSFSDLCHSNDNLLHMSDKLSSKDHVVPEAGDLSRTLARQLLFIEPIETPDIKE